MQPGFDRASEYLGAAHCEHTVSRGPGPAARLKVLQMCKNGRGCPLPSFSRQGLRAQPAGDPRGLSKPVCSRSDFVESRDVMRHMHFDIYQEEPSEPHVQWASSCCGCLKIQTIHETANGLVRTSHLTRKMCPGISCLSHEIL